MKDLTLYKGHDDEMRQDSTKTRTPLAPRLKEEIDHQVVLTIKRSLPEVPSQVEKISIVRIRMHFDSRSTVLKA